jgi:hypothetical protein
LIEMRVCSSCVSREHMCGGDCDCWCTKGSAEEWDELNWATMQAEMAEEENE